jgi:hypothetical protein
MTECLLVAIVSFVVLVNSVIQLCCHGGNGRSSRMWSNFELKNAQESNNTILTNPSALVRVSLWCLYIAICGLLCLFLLLKNSGKISDTETNILANKGELVILFFGGIFLLTLLFYRALRYHFQIILHLVPGSLNSSSKQMRPVSISFLPRI